MIIHKGIYGMLKTQNLKYHLRTNEFFFARQFSFSLYPQFDTDFLCEVQKYRFSQAKNL